MPRVRLSGSVQQQVGGLSTVEVAGDTVGAAIRALEGAYPSVRGWIVDERGMLRRHVKLFRGGVAIALDERIHANDELHIVAAISGG